MLKHIVGLLILLFALAGSSGCAKDEQECVPPSNPPGLYLIESNSSTVSISAWDPLSKTTYSYDGYRRLTQTKKIDWVVGTDPPETGQVTAFHYDCESHLTSQSMYHAHVFADSFTYQYNDNGRCTRIDYQYAAYPQNNNGYTELAYQPGKIIVRQFITSSGDTTRYEMLLDTLAHNVIQVSGGGSRQRFETVSYFYSDKINPFSKWGFPPTSWSYYSYNYPDSTITVTDTSTSTWRSNYTFNAQGYPHSFGGSLPYQGWHTTYTYGDL